MEVNINDQPIKRKRGRPRKIVDASSPVQKRRPRQAAVGEAQIRLQPIPRGVPTLPPLPSLQLEPLDFFDEYGRRF